VKVLSAGVKAAKKEKTGFAVATALTGPELVALLDRAGVGLENLDVVIAGSGSELYYAGPLQEGEKADKLTDKAGTKLHPDLDYNAHVEYRWGNDGLRKAMVNIVAAGSEKGAENGKVKPGLALVEDRERMGHHRLAYKVVDLQQAPAGSELRRRLRTRGLRCHVIYCRGNASLHLLPVHASRSQALRYLAVRWGIEVSNMIVVAGYAGDADHIELLGGAVRVILVGGVSRPENAGKGSAQGSTEGDPAKQPNVTAVDEGKGPEGIVDGLKELKLV
jgi:sucrose-phosphate synthase